MANVIENAAKAIRSRLAELVGEQEQLQKALGALEGLLGSERASEIRAHKAALRRRPARRAPAGARGRSTAPRRRGPSRADQFLELVAERPGITVAEAAARLKTSRQTLYNVTTRLQREGRLRKEGRGFYPVEQPPAPQKRPEPPPASA